MRIQALLLALALLTPTLTGCPPVRRGDDDDDSASVDDDDDSTQDGYALEEGRWVSEPVLATSDECGIANGEAELNVEITMIDGWSFRADFGVDAAQTCSIGSTGSFACPAEEFLVEEDPNATLRGSIAFEGDILTPTSLESVVDWVITCTGDCESYDLPSGVTCAITMEANFSYEPVNDPDPDVPPTDG